eukprot:TRINITY_DN2081_c0_g1_i1.p1 TRINITY_DN2081_c0_g1~~TRINITY_DN2081_c0_g1_i1.p1  ORF type:complete len:1269 (+),score=327.88 TRINITY_DN2081_c0_g1_i1:1956-5762(+)
MASALLLCMAAAVQPHIVVVLGDDVGYYNMGFTEGNVEAVTPNMDALAKGGVELRRHYVYKFCSPTRSGLMTGRLPIHVNQENPGTDGGGVDLRMAMMPEKLKEVGYSTHHVGKWHLGETFLENVPAMRGFDTSLGYLAGSEDHYTQRLDDNSAVDLWEATSPAYTKNGTYGAFLYTSTMVDLIRTHDPSTPFFLYAAFQNTHFPYEAPEQYLNNSIPEERRVYQAMARILDESIGNLTVALKANNMWDNTLFVYSADNGGASGIEGCASNNYPLRGGKHLDYEGGVRVGAFVNGGYLPEKVRGTRLEGYIHVADWYTTFARLAGYSPSDGGKGVPDVDGLDVWPMISGENLTSPRVEIPLSVAPPSRWREEGFPTGQGLIQGRYKIVTGNLDDGFWMSPQYPNATTQCGQTKNPGCPDGCLFDILADPSEYTDLKSTLPSVFADLKNRLQQLFSEVFQTAWPPNYTQNCISEAEAVNQHRGFSAPRCVLNATIKLTRLNKGIFPSLLNCYEISLYDGSLALPLGRVRADRLSPNHRLPAPLCTPPSPNRIRPIILRTFEKDSSFQARVSAHPPPPRTAVLNMLSTIIAAAAVAALRPPSVPLVVQDPYTSFWSPFDFGYDGFPVRWDGYVVGWNGVAKVDGDACRGWLGQTQCSQNADQVGIKVTATKTTYQMYISGKVMLNVTFRTPSAIEATPDYTMMTLPMSYMDFEVASFDGAAHNITIYFDVTGEATVSNRGNKVAWSRQASTNNTYLSIGNVDQTFASAQGSDDINWGHLNIGYSNADTGVFTTIGANALDVRNAFAEGQPLPGDSSNQRACSDGWPVLAITHTLAVPATGTVTRRMTIGYDQGDTYMQYFGSSLSAYWQHIHGNYITALDYATANSDDINKRCDAFDAKLTSDLTAAGSAKYAEMGALIYRQVTGAMVTTWNSYTSEAWVFMKEISSDGDVSTVDVIYPAAPMIFYYSPEMFRKLLLPVLVYASNGTAPYGNYVPYNLPWAPHHLGHWPVCDLPPNKQEQMPVEETGNLMILINYIVQQQNDTKWLAPFWDVIEMWGKYLPTALPDPGNQMCTDDFEGPSPHNVNLAIKGIVGIAAYSDLLKAKGDSNGAAQAMAIAKQYAQVWVANGTDSVTTDGVHTKLQYDLENTWSQKYNALWDQIFGFGLVPSDLLSSELKFYLTQMNSYGVPLDDRATFTKLDWSMWIAAMAPQEQFIAISDAIYQWANDTPDRVPFSDWTETTNAQHKGFQARPVMGGFWAKMIMEKAKAGRV